MESRKKLELHIAGPCVGPPTLEDLIALFESVKGRKATADEIAEATAAFGDATGSEPTPDDPSNNRSRRHS